MSVPIVQPSASRYAMFGYSWPTISSGVGLPVSTAEPDGSIYLRADAPDANNSLYISINGQWTPK
jgi:hypothetical protein